MRSASLAYVGIGAGGISVGALRSASVPFVIIPWTDLIKVLHWFYYGCTQARPVPSEPGPSIVCNVVSICLQLPLSACLLTLQVAVHAHDLPVCASCIEVCVQNGITDKACNSCSCCECDAFIISAWAAHHVQFRVRHSAEGESHASKRDARKNQMQNSCAGGILWQ